MKKTIVLIQQCFKIVNQALLVLSLSTMCIAVLLRIILRYTFSTSFLPLDDIIPYAFSISTFSGAALLFKERGHIVITFFIGLFNKRLRKVMLIFSEIVTLFSLIFFLIVGCNFVIAGTYQFSPLLHIPLKYIFLMVPFFALSSIIFMLDMFLETLKNRTPTQT